MAGPDTKEPHIGSRARYRERICVPLIEVEQGEGNEGVRRVRKIRDATPAIAVRVLEHVRDLQPEPETASFFETLWSRPRPGELSGK